MTHPLQEGGMSPETAHMMTRLSLVQLFTADKSFEVYKLSPHNGDAISHEKKTPPSNVLQNIRLSFRLL